jgi:hypothetical protein
MILLPFAVGLLLTSSANAFWRLPCNRPVARVRMDAIVDPGQPNQHLHSFMGSSGMYAPLAVTTDQSQSDRPCHMSGISPTATRDSLRAGNCTTCKVKADMSSYWAPEMVRSPVCACTHTEYHKLIPTFSFTNTRMDLSRSLITGGHSCGSPGAILLARIP